MAQLTNQCVSSAARFRYFSRMMLSKYAYIFAFLISAATATAANHTFSKEYETASITLPLRGTASYQYIFWKLYDAALYMPKDVAGEDVLGSGTPRALKLVYQREITAEQLVKSGTNILKKNYTAKQIADIQSGLDQINRCYQNVNEGDSYELVYVPGAGTSLILNGSTQCTIPGEDFAKIYFSIWLGPNAKSRQLNNALCDLE